MQPLTAKELIKVLESNGFVAIRQKGSHIIFRNYESGATVPVALHGGNKPIKLGTFRAIVKQSKLDKERFIK